MWETVELREIRIFLTLAEELHFGHTAERLNLSQSRVSQAVRSLEAQLGGQLFERTSRRVTLTPFGQDLLSDLHGPSDAISRALANAYRRSGRIDGTLTIAWLTPTAQGPHLPEILSHFTRHHPDCAVSFNEQLLGNASIRAVADGKADLLISWLPLAAPALTRGPIISIEERVLAVARDHPLADREVVTLEDVADYHVSPAGPDIPTEFLDTLVPTSAPSGRPLRRLRNRPASSLTDTWRLIIEGRIVHPTIPSLQLHFGHPDLILIPLDGLPPMKSALFWRRDADDPRVDAFVRAAWEVLPAELNADEAGAHRAEPDAAATAR
jgi:DNA-binding transcriptional LysR family regulator